MSSKDFLRAAETVFSTNIAPFSLGFTTWLPFSNSTNHVILGGSNIPSPFVYTFSGIG